MSLLDHLTDDEIEAAGEGIASLLLVLADNNIDPMPLLTQRAWEGLQAVAFAGTNPQRIAGAPDDDHALAAAGGN